MAYEPEPLLGLDPNLAEYLLRQLRLIAQAFDGVDNVLLDELHGEPAKPRLGMIVLADGVNWNPGSGPGFYGYDGSWIFLGGQIRESTGVAASHTGDTAETTVRVIDNPAAGMGLQGLMRVHSLWSFTNNANDKTVRMRYGAAGASSTHAGVAYLDMAFSWVASYAEVRHIANRNSLSSQVGPAADAIPGLGTSEAVIITSAINSALATELEFSVQLDDAGDSAALEAAFVEVIPG